MSSMASLSRITFRHMYRLQKEFNTHLSIFQGITVWFTGLSGAGKSTICQLVKDKLSAVRFSVEILDGDEVRKHLCAELGFSQEDRFKNIERAAFIAKLLSRNHIIVLASFITPYKAMRDYLKHELDPFVEVYVKCSLKECIHRDVKGLYRRALDGEVVQFTGISDPYEEPEHPDLMIDTEFETSEKSALKVLAYLRQQGFIHFDEEMK
ncbi:adenylyl-sulfate kinase [Paenibacillus prosopidis]|uniref:Adenylyl-sulfate kinase n=1 Tax=Paenibacillus prosopidis TaxID=630520 RepID=A0A368VYF7_9BACL|nr:adenylyl-sulfate kinase [Paenibacillus prosopidis]RCW46447.1 adenylylsulfate kinase [Paenibacillus prosopidis]